MTEDYYKITYTPRDGSPIFIEIDYRGDIDLDVGLIGVDGNELFKDYFVSLRSENRWKKSYVNLTDLVLNVVPAKIGAPENF